LASYQGGVTSNASVGQPFGVLRGQDFVYQNGQKVVASTGYYARTATANVQIADPNPKWRGGITNTVTYKSVSLNFLIDIRKGGQVFSLDRYYGLATGLPEETVGTNDLGNPSRNPLSQGGGVILPGVLADGSQNTKRVGNDQYGLYGYRRQPTSAFVYDAGFTKLREVALTYSLPKAWLEKTRAVKGVDLSLVGRNLWIISKHLPDADPEENLGSGNLGQGYSSGAYPTTRTIGANLRLSF
jgi:hypothetical protein